MCAPSFCRLRVLRGGVPILGSGRVVRLSAVLCCALLVWAAGGCRAQESDGQAWFRTSVTARLRGPWRLYGEVQPRLGDDYHHDTQFVSRWAVGYAVTRGWTLWLGAHFQQTLFPRARHETAGLFQLTSERRMGSAEIAHRFRYEHRVLEGSSGFVGRIRHMVRYTQWMDHARRWGWEFWHEPLWNLTGVARGPAAGLEQWRSFFGFAYVLNSHVRFDVGYMLLYGRNPDPQRDRRLDVLFLGTSFRL
jgi:hypothetical protein